MVTIISSLSRVNHLINIMAEKICLQIELFRQILQHKNLPEVEIFCRETVVLCLVLSSLKEMIVFSSALCFVD